MMEESDLWVGRVFQSCSCASYKADEYRWQVASFSSAIVCYRVIKSPPAISRTGLLITSTRTEFEEFFSPPKSYVQWMAEENEIIFKFGPSAPEPTVQQSVQTPAPPIIIQQPYSPDFWERYTGRKTVPKRET
jgi:hypothetical protein